MRTATGGGGVRYATGFRSGEEAKAYRDQVVAGIQLREMESLFAADDAQRSRTEAIAATGRTSRPAVRRDTVPEFRSWDDACDWLEDVHEIF